MKKIGHFSASGKYLVILLSFAVLIAGLVFALEGAAPTLVAQTRWSGGTAGNVITEGGNISAVNVNSASLTDKWAAFYGNVSGSINLTNGAASVYSWSWTAVSGGEVCVSTATSSANFGAAMTAAAAATVNSVYSLGTAADNATNTFTATNCTLNFTQANIVSAPYVKHSGVSSFFTCAVRDGVASAKANHLFCTNITSTGTAFNGQSANYELMVPTTPGTGTEQYYFYQELN